VTLCPVLRRGERIKPFSTHRKRKKRGEQFFVFPRPERKEKEIKKRPFASTRNEVPPNIDKGGKKGSKKRASDLFKEKKGGSNIFRFSFGAGGKEKSWPEGGGGGGKAKWRSGRKKMNA